MTSAGQARQLPTGGRRHGGGQGANLQLRTIPAADAKASWNPADQPARLLEIISPAGFERYFADLADILSGPGSPDPGQLAALAGRYGLDVDPASISRLADAHGLKVASRGVE
jgi:hypothetical protein